MMSANERKKTTGKLQATKTSVEGFSTDNVLMYQNLADGVFNFEGVQANGESLVFSVLTLNIKTGEAYVVVQRGPKGTAAAEYQDSSGEKYEGISGYIKFSVFDKLAQKAVFFAKTTIRSGPGIEKTIEVSGDFFSFESSQ